MVARGKAERWDARTKLGSYEDSSTRRGDYQQEAGRDEKRLHSRCAEGLTGQRCAVEMAMVKGRDG
jgi:hypothetical protein